MNRPCFALILAAGLSMTAMLGACEGPPPAAEPDPSTETEYPKVSATEGLNSHVVVGQPMAERDESGALSAVAQVRNQLNKDIPVQYRFIFFRDNGVPTDQEMEWRYEVLPPRTRTFLRATSLSSEATDWRCEIRPAR